MSRVSAPVSSTAKSQGNTGCTRVFFFIFFAVGCLLLYVLFLGPLYRIWNARNWPAVPCSILSSEVKSSRGSKGTTYSVYIQYAYQVDGREFHADRYSFFTGSSSGYRRKQEVVDRYPPGSQAICYANPVKPHEAVLHRGVTAALWWGLFPIPFLAVGTLAFLPSGFISNRSSSRGPLTSRGKSAKKAHRDDDIPPPHDLLSGPVELKASVSPMGKLLGLIFVALFWNGIISVFVGLAWKEIARGRPDWFLNIFLIPFVLIGLGLIGGVGYAFLNLFNPRIALLVSSRTVPLGDSLSVEWNFRGNSRRIRDLRIVLEGAERATYRRGTKTSTDENVFTKISLVETTDPAQIKSGNGRITIPGNVMHSFKAVNNEVVWKLKVNGTIAWFPDVSEEFPLTVLPHAHTTL